MCFGGGGSSANPNYQPAAYAKEDAWKQVEGEQKAATPDQLARVSEEAGGTAPVAGPQTSVPLLGRSLKGM